MAAADPAQWLTDAGLTAGGRQARREFGAMWAYLQNSGLLSYQVARARYFQARAAYWTLPDGFAPPPHTINLCVNNTCNLRCRYCDFGQDRRQTFYHRYNVVDPDKRLELDLGLLKDLVDQVAWFQPIIRASYREPLLYSGILPLIAHVKERGLPFWLLTNGLALPQKAAELARLGVDSVRLSLDGPPEVHDDLCGVKGACARMLEGVKLLLAERRRLGSAMQVGFYFTLNDANQHHILDTLGFLEKEGVLSEVFISFQWLLYTTQAMAEEHNRLHADICGGRIEESTVQGVDMAGLDLPAIAAQAGEAIARWPRSEGWRVHFRPSFELADLERYARSEQPPVPEPRCLIPWYNLTISPAGQVKAFQHCLLPVVGDVTQASIMDIWNGQALRGQRRALQEHGAYRGCARCWGLYSLLEDTRRRD